MWETKMLHIRYTLFYESINNRLSDFIFIIFRQFLTEVSIHKATAI